MQIGKNYGKKAHDRSRKTTCHGRRKLSFSERGGDIFFGPKYRPLHVTVRFHPISFNGCLGCTLFQCSLFPRSLCPSCFLSMKTHSIHFRYMLSISIALTLCAICFHYVSVPCCLFPSHIRSTISLSILLLFHAVSFHHTSFP